MRVQPKMMRLFLMLWLAVYAIALYATPAAPTLRDKIGQMIILGMDDRHLSPQAPILQAIDRYNLGGVVLSVDDLALMDNDRHKQPLTVHEIAALTKQLRLQAQHAALEHHRPYLPLLITTDEEGGRIDRFRTMDAFEPTVPPGLYPQLSQKKVAQEVNKLTDRLVASGFNLNFAPVVDININPANPIIGRLERSYSALPEEVVKFASFLAKTLNSKGILCTYKHFPGHGSASDDSHQGFVDVSRTWQPYELHPYQYLLSQPNACQFIMTAHVVNKQLDPSGLPATLSHTMLTQLLRKHLQFHGVIISDDMQMKALSHHYSPAQAITLAINAGVDMLLYTEPKTFPFKDVGELVTLIEQEVNVGHIPMQRINDAYNHITAAKHALNHD